MLPTDASVALNELIHPRAEPEFVFRLAEDLSGPGVETGDVVDTTSKIGGGIEVIDSHFEEFSFTLPDVIADNTSAAPVAVGASELLTPGEGVDDRGEVMPLVNVHMAPGTTHDDAPPR